MRADGITERLQHGQPTVHICAPRRIARYHVAADRALIGKIVMAPGTVGLRSRGKTALRRARTPSQTARIFDASPFFAVVVLAALLLGAITSQANPIFVDAQFWPRGRRGWEESRQRAMISENVEIAVGRGGSVVSGLYTFRGPRMRLLGSYEVYVPVLLPAGSARKYEAGGGEPVLRWGKRRLPMTSVAARPGFPTVALPPGWQMTWYAASISRNEVLGDFEAHITYTQPNFPDGSVGYVPLHPPKGTGSSKVIFKGKDGLLLRPFGPLSFISPGKPQLEFSPRNRKLLRVKPLATNTP